MKKFPIVGVGIVVIHDEKVLLGKRKGSHGAGTWAFPGGYLEFGESVESCVARELKEETGLIAHSFRMSCWTNNIISEEKHYLTIFAIVEKFTNEVTLLEPEKCEGWEWFEKDSFPEPLFFATKTFMEKESF